MSQEIGQYNCLKQTPSSKFVFLSHDKVSNIAYKMHMFVLSGDTTLGFMQYLEHLKFLEYLQGVEHEGDNNANDTRSVFNVI